MRHLLLFAATFLLASASYALQNEHRIIIRSEGLDLHHTPVYADFSSGTFETGTSLCIETGQDIHPAQLEPRKNGRQRVWWIANLPADTEITTTIRTNLQCPDTPSFEWATTSPQSERLMLGSQPILQYERPVFDYDNIEDTKKPYHHVFDPIGKEKITKGPGGLYPHHRGIFFGYNHIYLNGGEKQIDIWHAQDGERSEHEEIVATFAGPVMGGHTVRILWKDHDGQPFADELRKIRAFRQPDGEILIDFKTELYALTDHVKLDGDRQHAGVQFRASQYVADHPKHSRYIRPDAWSHIAQNEEIGDDHNTGFGWNAFVFRIEDRSYTVSYLSHESNPGPAEMSERLYGRFGEFFSYELTPDNPLRAQYQFWITTGNPPGKNQIRSRYKTFNNLPEITIK